MLVNDIPSVGADRGSERRTALLAPGGARSVRAADMGRSARCCWAGCSDRRPRVVGVALPVLVAQAAKMAPAAPAAPSFSSRLRL